MRSCGRHTKERPDARLSGLGRGWDPHVEQRFAMSVTSCPRRTMYSLRPGPGAGQNLDKEVQFVLPSTVSEACSSLAR